MKSDRPAANDVSPDFLAKRPFAEVPSAKYLQMARSLINHNLEMLFYRVKDDFFDAMKEIAIEGNEEKVRQADEAVRGIFYDEPGKMAQWEELMARHEFMEETLE
jgi:hypothetical protein